MYFRAFAMDCNAVIAGNGSLCARASCSFAICPTTTASSPTVFVLSWIFFVVSNAPCREPRSAQVSYPQLGFAFRAGRS